MKTGRLYGIGMGPGDPELITIKALKTIEKCPVIAVPCKDRADSVAYKIAEQVIENLKEKEILELDMPMTKNQEIIERKHKECAKQVVSRLKEGKDVAFLTLGDPSIYSTHIYINRLVEQEGIETELISGVTSFCAAAALINRGLASRGEMLHIVPASYPVEEALEYPGTRVLMKAGRNLGKIRKLIEEKGLDAVLVENCGLENEKVYEGVGNMPEKAGYFSIMIIE